MINSQSRNAIGIYMINLVISCAPRDVLHIWNCKTDFKLLFKINFFSVINQFNRDEFEYQV